MTREAQIKQLEQDWAENPRWKMLLALTPLKT